MVLAAEKFKSYCKEEQVTGDVEMQRVGTDNTDDLNEERRNSSESRRTEISSPPQRGQGAGYSSSDEESVTEAAPVIPAADYGTNYSGGIPRPVVMPIREEILSQTSGSMQNPYIPTVVSASGFPRGVILSSRDTGGRV